MYFGWRTRLSFAAGYLMQRRSDDGFIIAHPRSGSTWLRTIISNILNPNAHSNPDIFNTLIPGVSIRNAWEVKQLMSPRIMTSHTMYLPGLPKVVYLVRDGRDVLISFYHYMEFRKSRLHQTSGESNQSIDFATFLNRYYRGAYGHIWHDNVLSWLGANRERDRKRLQIVRFEDLRTNTEEFILKITSFLSIPASREQIAQAIEEAKIDRVRKIEHERWQDKGLGTPNSKTTFYGVGGKRPLEDYFSKDLIEEFINRSGKAMLLAGYNPEQH